MNARNALLGLVVLVIIAFILYFAIQATQKQEVNSFEECINAGNSVLESFPRQCITPDGRMFTESLPPWRTDDLTLMRIPETGELACFGCGATQCRDPIAGLDVVEETENQHCDEDFEIIT